MKKEKSKLESLSNAEIDEITRAAEKKKNVPLIKSSQVNMRLDSAHLARARLLASAQKIPYTTFLTRLLKEDIDRLWSVFKPKIKNPRI